MLYVEDASRVGVCESVVMSLTVITERQWGISILSLDGSKIFRKAVVQSAIWVGWHLTLITVASSNLFRGPFLFPW